MKLMRKNGGFTLVELIVVIAILAILAGIAVPAYSGYIQKAEKAADLQLLGAVNGAFQAACVAEGVNPQEIESASVALSGGKVTGVTPYGDTFNAFFEGNEDSAFKVITALAYVGNGVFADAADVGSVYLNIFNGIAGYENYKTDIKGSVGFTSIGAAGLTEKLDTVTGLAADLAGVNANFAASLAGSMGAMQASLGMSDAEFEEYIVGLVAAKTAQIDPDGTNPNAADIATNEILANYAVLNAAQNTAGKTTEEVISGLKGGFNVEDIKAMMNKDSEAATQQEGMANAAMMYAMYTAYANGPECEDKEAAKAISGDISGFATAMANTESNEYKDFQAYLDTAAAQNDAKAYLAAMNVINSSASTNPDVVTGLLTDGYNTPELTAALQQMMGG